MAQILEFRTPGVTRRASFLGSGVVPHRTSARLPDLNKLAYSISLRQAHSNAEQVYRTLYRPLVGVPKGRSQDLSRTTVDHILTILAVPYGSDLYHQCVALREEILRKPLWAHAKRRGAGG